MKRIRMRPRVQGYFKLTATKLDGTRRELTDWIPNLVTDTGLNRIGSGSYLTACHVGSNNATPNVLDTSLGGYMAGTTTVQSTSHGAQSTAPYYGWKTITYRFALGAVVGNVAEVAIATAAASTAPIFSRALVLDGGGSPTTVAVLADEVLDVTYQLRLYPDLVDRTGTITVTGSGSHDYTLRAAQVTSSLWGFYLGTVASFSPGSSDTLTVYNGAIGAVTSSPAGASNGVQMGNAGYTNNSMLRQGTGSFGMNQGNLADGIKSARFTTSLGIYQVEFDPVIPKTAADTLSLTFQISWARNV